MKTIRLSELGDVTENVLVQLATMLADPATEYPLVIDDSANPMFDVGEITIASREELEEYVEGFAMGTHESSGSSAS